MMGGAVRLKRAGALPFQKLNEEVLVVDPKSREVHLLNPTATRIWELLERDHTAAELVTALASEYDADPVQVGRDVEALLVELGTKGLVAEIGDSRRPPSRGR